MAARYPKRPAWSYTTPGDTIHLALFTPQGQNFVILEGYLSPNGSVASLKPVLQSFRTAADRFVERIDAG